MTFPWEETIRRETGLIEHVCKCGVGHPAIGSVQWLQLRTGQDYGVHGCCGCCRSPEWKLADAQEGCRKANELLSEYVNKFRDAGEVLLQRNHEIKTLKQTAKDSRKRRLKTLTEAIGIAERLVKG